MRVALKKVDILDKPFLKTALFGGKQGDWTKSLFTSF
jgi:hypothetical protein